MAQDTDPDRWARLRFTIIGPLLAAPPPKGELGKSLVRLSQKSWRHPVNGIPVRFSAPTLERWYYIARGAHDPVAALRRRRREDAGRNRQLSTAVIQALRTQYRQWSGWTIQLHYDNLVALSDEEDSLGSIPSYATIRRYMKAQGLHRKRPPKRNTAGAEQAERRLESHEVRSFESDYVLGLWHLDFHHGSLKVLTPAGQWVRPLLLGILDDHSRVVCHLCTTDQIEPAVQLVNLMREHYPGVAVHARAHDRQHCDQLLKAGATIAISESLEASLQIGGAVLSAVGISDGDTAAVIEAFRKEYYV